MIQRSQFIHKQTLTTKRRQIARKRKRKNQQREQFKHSNNYNYETKHKYLHIYIIFIFQITKYKIANNELTIKHFLHSKLRPLYIYAANMRV